jgi:capsular polysaccharide biosynthesis protein
MLERLMPLARRVRHRLGRPRQLHEACSRSWVICEAHDEVAPPALFDEADIARITDVNDWTLEAALAVVRGGLVHHDATIAFELRDALLTGGHLFAPRYFTRLAPTPVPHFAPPTVEQLPEALLVSTAYGIKYFGHWLSDDLPLYLAAADLGLPAVSAHLGLSDNQRQYLELLDLQAHSPLALKVGRLVVLQDHAQNAYKSKRYGLLRARMRARLTTQADKPVMLLRGQRGARRVLANEKSVIDLARGHGLDIVDPTSMDALALVGACSSAPLVLGVEGSHLANAVTWMRPGGTLLTLQPAHRFDTHYKGQCDVLGLRFGFIVCDSAADGSFVADLTQLARMLERVQDTANAFSNEA